MDTERIHDAMATALVYSYTKASKTLLTNSSDAIHNSSALIVLTK